MDLDLDGKIAVVTGASKGIGLAVAEALTAEGVVVVAGARSPGTDLPALAERHENGSPGGTRGRVVFVPVDLRSRRADRAGRGGVAAGRCRHPG